MSPHATRYEALEGPRKAVVMLYVIAGAWYLAWRVGTLNPDSLLFSVLIYAAELYGFVTSLLHIFMCRRLTVRSAPLALAGRSVDVFVTTYNESVDMLRKTLIATLRMDYPHTTWLLDDGNRAEMRALAEELGCRYLSRTDNTHAKAGNLNNALSHSSGELIAVFDSDHAPRKDFLLRLLGYFDDERVAFVQSPQDFFNLDSYQHRRGQRVVWTEQSLFFEVIQRGKDSDNAAFYCGSCAIIRRSALDDIGGFATGTITEDLHTSLRLHARGWRSIYHAESVAFGIAPENIYPFLRQRVRWGQGAMQVWRREGVLTNSGLTLAQRLNYFASMSTYFDGWQKGIFYIAPVLVLTTSQMPLVTETTDFLWHFVPFYLLNFWMFEEIGRGYGRTVFIEQYNMARFAAFAWSTLALFARPLRFLVTPKDGSVRQWGRPTAPQMAVLALNALAIPVGLLIYAYYRTLPVEGLVANVIWAGVNAALALAVVRFNRSTSAFRRSTYRFPVPLPAILRFPGSQPSTGIIGDVSSEGFRFHGSFPGTLAAGDEVSGSLRLPDGTVEIRGVVRNIADVARADAAASRVRSIGCQFRNDRETSDRLAAFLYGSNLQWQINALRNRISTPLARLLPSAFAGPAPDYEIPGRWTACHVGEGDERDLALFGHRDAAEDGAGGTALLFAYRGEGFVGTLTTHRGGQLHAQRRRFTLSRTFGVGTDSLYAYRLEAVDDEASGQWLTTAVAA